MSSIRRAFDQLLEQAASEDERSRLQDAARAAELIAAVQSAGERRAVLAILEKLDVLADLADTIEKARIAPVPGERVRRREDDRGDGGPPEPFLID